MKSFSETFFSSFLIILFLGLSIQLMLESSLCLADQNVLTIGDPNPQQRAAVSDDHGNTRGQATSVGPESSTPGVLERGGDLDYFQIEVTEAGTLTVGTTGTSDTAGVLRGSTGAVLAQNNDSDMEGGNFQIVQEVSAETYYVGVSGHDDQETGRYRLFVLFTPTDQVVSNLRSLLGAWRFTFEGLNNTVYTFIWRLHSVVTTSGTPIITGTDEFGNSLIVGRMQDLAPGNTGYDDMEFVAFKAGAVDVETQEVDNDVCFVIPFNKKEEDEEEKAGFYIQGFMRDKSDNGDCSERYIDHFRKIGIAGSVIGITDRHVTGRKINISSQGGPIGSHLLKKK